MKRYTNCVGTKISAVKHDELQNIALEQNKPVSELVRKIIYQFLEIYKEY